MQAHRFWLIDVKPSATFPFFVLGSPLFGFKSITAPEITLDAEPIAQLNSVWKRQRYVGGEASPITLERGVTAWDSTFYEWIKRAQRGSDMINRDLLLLHFMGWLPGQGEKLTSAMQSLQMKIPVANAWEGALKIPGRAFIMWDCLPTRYKVGSDFDATASEVSIMELEIHPMAVAEISLLSPL